MHSVTSQYDISLHKTRDKHLLRIRKLRQLLTTHHNSRLSKRKAVLSQPTNLKSNNIKDGTNEGVDGIEKEKQVFEAAVTIVHRLKTEDETELIDICLENNRLVVCTKTKLWVWEILRYGADFYKTITNNEEESVVASDGNRSVGQRKEELKGEGDWPNLRTALNFEIDAPVGLSFRQVVLSPDAKIVAVLIGRNNVEEKDESVLLFCAKTGEMKINLDVDVDSCILKDHREMVFFPAEQSLSSPQQDQQRSQRYTLCVTDGRTLIRYLFCEGYRRIQSRKVDRLPEEFLQFKCLSVILDGKGYPYLCVQYELEATLMKVFLGELFFYSFKMPQKLEVLLAILKVDNNHQISALCSESSQREEIAPTREGHCEMIRPKMNTRLSTVTVSTSKVIKIQHFATTLGNVLKVGKSNNGIYILDEDKNFYCLGPKFHSSDWRDNVRAIKPISSRAAAPQLEIREEVLSSATTETPGSLGETETKNTQDDHRKRSQWSKVNASNQYVALAGVAQDQPGTAYAFVQVVGASKI